MAKTSPTLIVIPTYWSRAGGIKQEGDIIYDHPTPVNEDGTLKRTLESLKMIDEFFTLVLIVAPVHPSLNEVAGKRVKSIVASVARTYNVLIFSPSALDELYTHCKDKIPDIKQMVNLDGYSQIRNLCILIPYLLDAKNIVLLDDDEMILDPDFLTRAVAFIGEIHDGRKIFAKAGYYLQPYGGYKLEGSEPWWKRPFFNKKKVMNQAFSIIDSGPRIKDTPFVFGGNMVVARDLVKAAIPFDPYTTRGEDIDYLTNVKAEGYVFVLDRELRIMHKPPPSHHEKWVKLREDIIRFLYGRRKLIEQQRYGVKKPIKPEDLDPYPGYFIDSSITSRAFFTCLLLALDYVAKMRFREAVKTLQTISLLFYDYGRDVAKFYTFKKRWMDDILPILSSDTTLKRILTSKIS